MSALLRWLFVRGSYRKALAKALVAAAEALDTLVVLDADTPRSTGTWEFAKKFPERFFNVGISEQDLVCTAAGMAVAGLTPVAVAFASFLTRGWEQIRNTIARDGLNVKLVGTHAGLSAHFDGSSHQSLEDLALMRAVPGMAVVAPADEVATYALVLEAVTSHRGPLYVRLGRDNAPRVYEEGKELKLGWWELLEEGSDFALLSHGPMVSVALEVSRLARREGYSADVIDAHTVKPLDEGALLKAAAKSGRVVVLEEHSVVGGLGSASAELLSEKRPTPVLRLGLREAFGTSSRAYEELLAHYGLTADRVWLAVKKWLSEVGRA